MSFRLKDRLHEKILEWRPRTEKLLKEYGNVVIEYLNRYRLLYSYYLLIK